MINIAPFFNYSHGAHALRVATGRGHLKVSHDAPEPWQLGFQDAASPIMEEVIFLHDQIMFILTLIITTVL